MDRRAAPEEPEDDYPLFDEPRARHTDPETSHEAARSVSEEISRTIRAHVLTLLRARGPLTDEDLVFEFGVNNLPGTPSGIRTRRKELQTAGLVRESGYVGLLASGRFGIKWEAKPEKPT